MPVDPAALAIQIYPAPVLRVKAAPVPAVTAEVRAVAARMIELMYEAEGIGLAAPQVGLSWRLFVVDVPGKDRGAEAANGEGPFPEATDGPRVYINPVLAKPIGPPEPLEEGCLSLPEIRGDVLRSPVITISALDEHGRPVAETAGGLLARCWQHEMDHLDGVLIIDRFTQLSRMKNRIAVRDLERQ